MRISSVLIFSLLLINSALLYGYDFTGHSGFVRRTVFQTASPEKESLWHYDFMNTPDACYCGTFEIVPLGGTSIHGDCFARFFAPEGKTTLRVVEFKDSVPFSTNDLESGRDLEARNFNIQTRSKHETFISKISIHPKHRYWGAGFAYRQRLWDRWWCELSFPVIHVENSIEFEEKIINDGGGAASDVIGLNGQRRVGSVKQAFLSKKGMRFGRIEPDVKHKKTGIEDIELKLGWNTYCDGDAHFRSYLGVVIPTGNKPDPKVLFPAVVGNNKHVGVFFGSNFGFPVWCYGEHKMTHEIDTSGRYLFPNHQRRTFDLKDSQWSRYQEVYADRSEAIDAALGHNPDSGTFGTDVFTRSVKVEPRFATTFNTAFIYSYCDWLVAEAGYNFYARQGERIEFDKNEKERFSVAVKHIKGKGNTSIARTIQDNVPAEIIPVNEFTPISFKDLEVNSAAHPPVISQIVYGTVGYRCNEWCYPTLFAVGSSYEFSHSNGGFQRWMVWGKAAMNF